MQLPAVTVLVTLLTIGALNGALVVLVYHQRKLGKVTQILDTDALTGLGSRHAWNKLAASTWPRGEQTLVMLLDLDGFKPVNDCYDHHVGDLVLREFAARLRYAAGPDGRVFRLGGDEFVVVSPLGRVTISDAVIAAAERAWALHQQVTGPWGIPGGVDDSGWSPPARAARTIRIETSIGVTSGDPRDLTRLLAVADGAMYAAKQTRAGVAYRGLGPVPPPRQGQVPRPAVRRRDLPAGRPQQLGPSRRRAAH